MMSRVSAARSAFGVVAAFGLLAAPSICHAGLTAPEFLMTWDANQDGLPSNTYNWDAGHGGFGTLHPFGDHSVGQGQPPHMQSGPWSGWAYTGTLTNSLWTLEWNCVFNDDLSNTASGTGAFVIANIVVTNNSPATQNFSLLMSMPVARTISNPQVGGSVVGTVTDLTFDNATVSAPLGQSIYTARIDGVDEQQLMAAPFAQSAGGPLQSSVVGPDSFGQPLPVPGSQAVDTSIAIFLNFDLTAGDSGSFTAIFEVVPAPGVVPVLAMFGLIARRRRRA
jgi:hypothetical protein